MTTTAKIPTATDAQNARLVETLGQGWDWCEPVSGDNLSDFVREASEEEEAELAALRARGFDVDMIGLRRGGETVTALHVYLGAWAPAHAVKILD